MPEHKHSAAFGLRFSEGSGRGSNASHPHTTCLLYLAHPRSLSSPITNMSFFVKKMKMKTGRLIDNLRPGSRAPSPLPPNPDPDPVPQAPAIGSHSYADPQTPQTAGSTAGSVIYELLTAARDGSDLCLPLKAALVGVVKIWDVCEVKASPLSRLLLIGYIQRTIEVKEEYKKLESRLAHLYALTQAYGKRNHLDPNLKLRLETISRSVSM